MLTPITPLRLEDNLKKKAKNAAKKQKLSLAAWIRTAIIQKLERDSK